VVMVTAPALPAHLPMSAARKVADLKKSSLVLVERDGRLVGVVDDVALLQAPDEARLEDAMKRLEVCLTPATPLARAREQLARSGATALPVAAGAFLLGVVTRAAVERAWRERQRLDVAQARPAAGRGRRADVPGADVDLGPRRHAA